MSIEALAEEASFEAGMRRGEHEPFDEEGGGEETFGLEEEEELVAEGHHEIFGVEAVHRERDRHVGAERLVLTEHQHDERTHELAERGFGRRCFGFDREVAGVIGESKHVPPSSGAEVGSRS